MMIRSVVCLAAAIALAGCFTVCETEYKQVPMTRYNGPASVAVRGFEATLLEYITLYGVETYYVPGHYGRRHWRPGHYRSVQTTSTVPRQYVTERFADQAKDRLEESGFMISANPADYIVDVRFTGPVDGSAGVRALWWVFSLLTCDSAEQTWSAKLKIYDNKTGKLLFTNVYYETYSATCFSPVPLFGPAAYERTGSNYMQCWCLHALTDRVTAEAGAFIASIKR